MKKALAVAAATVLLAGVSLTGCENVENSVRHNKTTQGALIGAGTGAVGGALVGEATTGSAAKGALIGAGVGAAAGAGTGYYLEKKDKD